jgi:hypothetical protein
MSLACDLCSEDPELETFHDVNRKAYRLGLVEAQALEAPRWENVSLGLLCGRYR